MYYDITDRKSNFQAHLRIDSEMVRTHKGIYSFVLRVNNQNIVDVVVMENENYGTAQDNKQN